MNSYLKIRQTLRRNAVQNLQWFANVLPESRAIYHFCSSYLNRYNGDNNADMHTNGEIHWLQSVLGDCKVVFDVGAYIGDWTKIALEINPQLHIHCFEPSSATFQRLRSQPFVDERVTVNRAGLGASVGRMTFYSFGEGSSMNSLYIRTGLTTSQDQAQTEEIEINTLDAYCAAAGIQQIDLLKIDVEGNELQVLQGASELLAKKAVSYIQFEYGGTYIDSRILLKDIFELLLPYGYRLHKLHPDKLQYVSQYEQRLENFQYQNWIATA